MEADAVRRRLHPEGVVTYIIDRNINYTNFCTEYCTFCAFYRPLKGPQGQRGLHPRLREDLREDRRDGGDGRHRRADAGRHPSRPEDRLVREPLHRHQAAVSADLAALPVGVGSAGDCGVLRARPADHDCAPARCRAGFDSRRRRGDSRRRCAQAHRAPEVPHRGLGQRASHRSPARHAHHGDHDVRRGRDV